LLVAFQDEGPGIKTGEHEYIFERFFTSKASATAAQSGTGLGLPIAKLIVDRIGGSIRFDRDIQQGAKCLIEVPISE
jgi:signal transduction histidine kinase